MYTTNTLPGPGRVLLPSLLLLLTAALISCSRGEPENSDSGPANSSNVAPMPDPKPKYAIITPDVIRDARFIDMDVGGERAAELNARYDAVEADWASATFIPATSPASAIASALQASVYDVDDVLTPAQRESLLTKIAEYVSVRAQTTPDAYFELAAREPNLAWHDPTAPYSDVVSKPFRDQLSWLYENYGDGPVDPAADTPKLLRDIWRPMMDTHGQRIAEVGYGGRGAAIIVMRSRLPARTTNLGFADLYSSRHGQPIERWDGYANSLARPFRVPVSTSDDVLNKHGVVTLAAAHIITRLALSDEHIFVWQLLFHLDPETQEWRCEIMGKSGSRNWQVVF